MRTRAHPSPTVIAPGPVAGAARTPALTVGLTAVAFFMVVLDALVPYPWCGPQQSRYGRRAGAP